MMTLDAAIKSGRKFRRGTTGSFVNASAFLSAGVSIDSYNATDYVLEPSVTISAATLVEAWNRAAGPRRSIAPATESRFFADFKRELAASGISISG